jgi:hypothetical protein
MKLSKLGFLIPAATLGFAVAVSAGACSNSVGVTLTPTTPPMDLMFTGGQFGGECSGEVYVDAGVGWAFCDDDKWAYTTTDPSTAGYKEFTPSTDGGSPEGSSGADGGPLEDGSHQQGIDASNVEEGGHQQGLDASVEEGGQKGNDGGPGGGGDGGPQGH